MFRLSPSGAGYTETVLHRFPGGSHDGNSPTGIVMDSTGDLYGTTFLGGLTGYGSIYKLTPTVSGPWTESAIHNFTGGAGGGWPMAGVIFGVDGSLYGTTTAFGAGPGTAYGTVYKVAP